MNINFELYKVFYYVAKTLSFSSASRHLYITQSAVSQSIKTLEEKLNMTLFSRHTKAVKLTTEGQILFDHIEKAFHMIKAGERGLQEIHSLKIGEVKLGASDTICKYHLLPFFKEFHEQYPHIKINVTNRPSPVCIELLDKGVIDIAVVNLGRENLQKNLTVVELQKIEDVFVAGSNFVELKDREVSLKDLEKYPLLLLEKYSTTREYFEALIQENKVDLVPEFELGSVDLLVELTKIGLGISFLMKDAVKNYLEGGDLFTLNLMENIPLRSLGAVVNNSTPLPPASQKFLELLDKTFIK